MVRIASLGDQLMQPIKLRQRALERQLHQGLIGLGFVFIERNPEMGDVLDCSTLRDDRIGQRRAVGEQP